MSGPCGLGRGARRLALVAGLPGPVCRVPALFWLGQVWMGIVRGSVPVHGSHTVWKRRISVSLVKHSMGRG